MVTVSEVANVASGIFIMALGAFVLTVKPRRPGNLAFATFALGFGVSIAVSNLVALPARLGTLEVIVLVCAQMTATAGLVGMMVAFPAPVPQEKRKWVWTAMAFVIAATAVLATIVPGTDTYRNLQEETEAPAALINLNVASIGTMAFSVAAYIILIALFVRGAGRDDPVRRQYALITVALALYAAYVAGGGVTAAQPVFPITNWTWATSGVLLAAMLVLAVLWLREAATGPEPRTARNIALLVLALPLLGLILSATGGAYEVRGVLRTFAVAILAYAMLRHQLLGIDVKVRWTISKSTVAGIFVTVFFIASEGAQLVLGGQSEVMGLFAAGALVFAISPLQRVADRIAVKAVPLPALPRGTSATPAAAPAAGPLDDREEVYRNALRLALRDTRLSRTEEQHLFRLARSLHIEADRAHELLVEAERKGRGRR